MSPPGREAEVSGRAAHLPTIANPFRVFGSHVPNVGGSARARAAFDAASWPKVLVFPQT